MGRHSVARCSLLLGVAAACWLMSGGVEANGIEKVECEKEVPKQKYIYLGCFGDAGTRDLSYRQNINPVSVEACYRACDSLRYKYFGLQSGHMCHCGNTYGLYGQKSERECYRRCNGNADDFCGGDWRNCLYEIKLRNQF